METKIALSRRDPLAVRTDVALLFMFADETLPAGLADEPARRLRGRLSRRRFKADAGRSVLLEPGLGGPARMVLVTGLGDRDRFGMESLHLAGAAARRAVGSLAAKNLVAALPDDGRDTLTPRQRAQALLEGLLLGGYRYDRFRSTATSGSGGLARMTIATGGGTGVGRQVVATATTVAAGVGLARDLVNEPAGSLTPEVMANRARRIGRAAGLTVKVHGKPELKRMQMRALLEVAVGSDRPPRVVHLVHKPTGRARRKLVLVGKGVTFDAGGYNLKGTASIADMKCDMAGAAAVLGAMQVVARLGADVEVHALLGLVENLVSGRAYKPGDVIRTRGGKTVEINNTDAEGRLVMADLLDYAKTRIRPDAVIDVATLTGAAVVALGPLATGVMANDEPLREEMLAAAARAGEKMWPLPLYPEYRDDLKSDIADLRNSGGRYGAALTAGLFLEQFVDDKLPWCHLDIAGPAFLNRTHPFWGKGGTGAAVPTLVEFLTS